MAVRGTKGLEVGGLREVHIPLNSLLSKKKEAFILPHIITHPLICCVEGVSVEKAFGVLYIGFIVNRGLDRKKGFRDRTIQSIFSHSGLWEAGIQTHKGHPEIGMFSLGLAL